MKISTKVTAMIVSSLLVLGAILVFLNIYEQNKAIEFSTKELTETVLADKRAALTEEMDIVSNILLKIQEVYDDANETIEDQKEDIKRHQTKWRYRCDSSAYEQDVYTFFRSTNRKRVQYKC